MKNLRQRKYYIVKHNLEAFEALPNFIWRSDRSKRRPPRGFLGINAGDRWIGFAYTATDDRQQRLSLITGFYECVQTAHFGRLTQKAQKEARHKGGAWLIRGRPYGPRVDQPIVVPPINTLLRRKAFGRTTFVPVNSLEFARIVRYVKSHEFNPANIPLIQREPRGEQEVLAIVAFAHKKLGIERILRARTRFPDLLVKLKGKREPVHLELEVYSKSFFNHDHHLQIGRGGMFLDGSEGKNERHPVGVLSWIDDDKNSPKTRKRTRVRDYVQRVFELQSLIRRKEEIRW